MQTTEKQITQFDSSSFWEEIWMVINTVAVNDKILESSYPAGFMCEKQ